jgi:fumarate hydratase class II
MNQVEYKHELIASIQFLQYKLHGKKDHYNDLDKINRDHLRIIQIDLINELEARYRLTDEA